MKFYVNKSEQGDAVNLGIAHEAGSGFASVPVDKRTLLHAASAVGMAAALGRLAKQMRAVNRRQKEAERRLELLRQPRKGPRRSTGMNLNIPHRLHKHKGR